MQHTCSCKSLTKIVNTAVVGMWLLFRGYSEGRSSLLIGIWISLFLISESKQWDFDLISSVQLFSHVQLFVTPLTAAHQASLSVTNFPGACSNSCKSSQWCPPTISSPVIPFPSCLQSFPVPGSFLMSQFFASGGQSTAVSASPSGFPMNIPDWFPLGWTDLISLQSKGLSRVFSNTTVKKHQFFDAQLSLWSNSHIHTWLLEKP